MYAVKYHLNRYYSFKGLHIKCHPTLGQIFLSLVHPAGL